ncbi:MAG: hypothetical protein ACRDJE_28570, partial [Dehalococcoidia bacterium]
RLGTTPEMLVIESLQERFGVPSPEETVEAPNGTLADALRDVIGVLHSSEFVPGGARLSENTGEKYAAELLKRRRQAR